MEIQELYLKRYGKFHDHRILLKPGINIIYGGNEAGKSTIHSFIKAMLFGLNRSRGKAARTDEFQLRQPWETPGTFSGAMTVKENGKVYRIERCFDRSTTPLRIFCETTGEELPQPEQTLEWLLGGISETAFSNTMYISQFCSETDEGLSQELRRYVVNSETALDSQLDVSQALQTLRKKKKYYEQKKKKDDEQMEQEIAGKQIQAEKLRGELDLLKRQQGAVRYETRSAEPETPKPEKKKNGIRIGRIVLTVLLLLSGALALAGSFYLDEWKLKVFLGVFGVVFLLMILPVHFLLADDDEDASEDVEQASGQIQQKVQPQQDSSLAEAIQSRMKEYQRLQDELEKLYQSHVRPEGAETEIAALSLAIDRICELSSGIYAKSGGRLNARASEILSELTGGSYTRIRLNEMSEIQIETPQRMLSLQQVSGGTMQRIYFALRMAAGELLCDGKELPVILDETFAMYDDSRLEAVLRWLKQNGRQVVLFTCQRREREILAKIDADNR